MEQDETFRLLWETTTDAVLQLDDRGRILSANAAVEEVFGYLPAEIVGQGIEVLQPESLRAAHRKALPATSEPAKNDSTGAPLKLWASTGAGAHSRSRSPSAAST